MPRTVLRVVWGTGDTIETFSPQRALTNVDLPAEGLPAMATKADFGIGLLDEIRGRRLAPGPELELRRRLIAEHLPSVRGLAARGGGALEEGAPLGAIDEVEDRLAPERSYQSRGSPWRSPSMPTLVAWTIMSEWSATSSVECSVQGP
jgi:hypothetical protein